MAPHGNAGTPVLVAGGAAAGGGGVAGSSTRPCRPPPTTPTCHLALSSLSPRLPSDPSFFPHILSTHTPFLPPSLICFLLYLTLPIFFVISAPSHTLLTQCGKREYGIGRALLFFFSPPSPVSVFFLKHVLLLPPRQARRRSDSRSKRATAGGEVGGGWWEKMQGSEGSSIAGREPH